MRSALRKLGENFFGVIFVAYITAMAISNYLDGKVKYDFTVFSRTPLGMEAYQNLGVDHVVHMDDGSICFRDVQNDVYGCEKATDYTLKPAGIEQ